jgi:hypothetical protein
VGQVKFPALADYIAFISLAQIDPEASPKTAGSILNLFSDRVDGRATVEEMTDWDFAYITGVYEARRDTFNSEAQKRDITRTMGETLSQPAKTPDAPQE